MKLLTARWLKSPAGFWAALGMIGLGGALLLRLMTPDGMGLVNDSVTYVVGAQTLLAGQGYGYLFRPGEVTPTTHFPPATSALLALAGWLGGLLVGKPAGEMVLPAADWVMAGLYGLNGVLLGVLLRIAIMGQFRQVWALFGAGIFAVSAPFLRIHSFVMSEPLFLTWVYAFLILCLPLCNEGKKKQPQINTDSHRDIKQNLKKQSVFIGVHRWLKGFYGRVILLGLLAAGAYWTRYIGVTLFGVGAFAILFLWGGPWRTRAGRVLLFGLVGGLAALPWPLRNWLVAGNPANRQVFWRGLADWRINEGLTNLWNCLLPDVWNAYERAPLPLAVLTVIIIVGLAALVIAGLRRLSWQGAALIAAEALAYLAVTLGSMAVVDSSILLDNRLVAPFYALLWPLMVWGLAELWSAGRGTMLWKGAAGLLALLLALSAAWDGFNAVRTTRWDGQGYAGGYWRNSTTLDALQRLPRKVIYSTRPYAITIRSGLPAIFVPSQFNPGTRQERPDFRADLEQMRRETLGGQAYVVMYEYRLMQVDPAQAEWTRDLTEGLPLLGEYADGAIFGVR